MSDPRTATEADTPPPDPLPQGEGGGVDFGGMEHYMNIPTAVRAGRRQKNMVERPVCFILHLAENGGNLRLTGHEEIERSFKNKGN